jgi:hypothetical protein
MEGTSESRVREQGRRRHAGCGERSLGGNTRVIGKPVGVHCGPQADRTHRSATSMSRPRSWPTGGVARLTTPVKCGASMTASRLIAATGWSLCRGTSPAVRAGLFGGWCWLRRTRRVACDSVLRHSHRWVAGSSSGSRPLRRELNPRGGNTRRVFRVDSFVPVRQLCGAGARRRSYSEREMKGHERAAVVAHPIFCQPVDSTPRRSEKVKAGVLNR